MECNLTANHLATLPAYVGDMVGLRSLLLGNNRLAALPYKLGFCSEITDLQVGDWCGCRNVFSSKAYSDCLICKYFEPLFSPLIELSFFLKTSTFHSLQMHAPVSVLLHAVCFVSETPDNETHLSMPPRELPFTIILNND